MSFNYFNLLNEKIIINTISADQKIVMKNKVVSIIFFQANKTKLTVIRKSVKS